MFQIPYGDTMYEFHKPNCPTKYAGKELRKIIHEKSKFKRMMGFRELLSRTYWDDTVMYKRYFDGEWKRERVGLLRENLREFL